MGADIRAFVQIDDNTPTDQVPFTNDPSTWDLTHDIGLSAGKHYEFYAAICGIRNTTGKSPLFSWRGLPACSSHHDPVHCLAGDNNVSWLTLAEIQAALTHQGMATDGLGKPVQLLLQVMAAAEELYGAGRVRLVFQVID